MTTALLLIGILLAATGFLSPPLALAAGLVYGIVLTHPFPQQSATLSKFLLKASVVGLGFGMNLGQLIKTGSSGFVYTAIGITFALVVGTLLGRTFRVEKTQSLLICVGTAICGGSAIAAVGPVVNATDEEMAVSLGTVFVLNSVALFLFPLIGSRLRLTQTEFGLWSALAIHDTSSVVGAAAKYGPTALVIATTVKLARALWIVPVTLATAVAEKSKARIQWPLFIALFAIAAMLNTILPRLHPVFLEVSVLARLGLSVTLFLIGTGISRKVLRQVGVRPMMQGIVLWVIVATLSLLAIRRSLIALSTTFTILHTNDIHGDIKEFVVDTGDATAQTGDPGRAPQEYPRYGVIGGFPRLAGAVRDIRQARGATNVILVDAGDTFGDQLLSNITRGEDPMRLMDALGYTFMALGNHDYEYTAANTERLQRLVRFPMRAANAIVRATGQPFLGDPTLVVTVGGVRVGLLALTYHNTDQTENQENTRDLAFRSGIDVARTYIPALRRRAAVVVVVSHQGRAIDSLLALRVPGIDIIVGGHSHDRIQPPKRVGDTWIVQALSDASALGELTVTVTGGRVARVDGVVHELYADRYQPDARFTTLLEGMRAKYRDTLEAVIATAADRIGRHYQSESPIDVLAARILRDYGQADAAFLPGLGFGVTIQPGPITREMVVGLFPHPTTVVHEELTGAQILTVLEQTATNLRPIDELDRVGGMVQTAGMRWTIDLTRPVGQRIRDIWVGARRLDPHRSYAVMTTGALLQGTHRYTAFARGSHIIRDEKSFATMLEEALRRTQIVRAPRLGAVTLIK